MIEYYSSSTTARSRSVLLATLGSWQQEEEPSRNKVPPQKNCSTSKGSSFRAIMSSTPSWDTMSLYTFRMKFFVDMSFSPCLSALGSYLTVLSAEY